MKLLRKIWRAIQAWFYAQWLAYQTERLTAFAVVEQVIPGKEALRRIALSGLCPPDTVSMGICNGGYAVFFKHDRGQEVIIGNDYDHAADKFLEWLRETQARGEGYAPTTKKTTKLNRHDRRAYASKKYRNSQQKRKRDRT